MNSQLWKPTFLNPFQINKKGWNVIDRLENQLEELFLLRHPPYRFQKNFGKDFQKWKNVFLGNKTIHQIGKWVYYPWLDQTIHYLDESEHQEIRTGRNRFLITDTEQKKFYQAKIGILGLSVGSHAALTITMTGGSKYLKLADPDVISGSNLNRIRSPFSTVGLNKAVSVARQIVEINPYAKLTLYTEGLLESNIEKFLLKPKIDILIEEMDNLYLKIRVREIARKHGIPVIMAADNGDNAVIDVERYDLDAHYPILHGLLGSIMANDFKKIKPQAFPKLIGKVAAGKFSTLRMLQSVMAVGKEIYSWPQLGNAATLCGSVLTYLARKIILGERIKSGRTNLNIDKIFCHFPPSYEKERQLLLKKIL